MLEVNRKMSQQTLDILAITRSKFKDKLEIITEEGDKHQKIILKI